MSSMWKKALHHGGGGDDGEDVNEKRLTPLSHRRLMNEDKEERRSLVESEADSDDDILQFDEDKEEIDQHLSPKHRASSPLVKRSPSPLRKSPLLFLKKEQGNQEERASLIDENDDDSEGSGERPSTPVQEIGSKPIDHGSTSSPVKPTDSPSTAVPRPVASKWARLRLSAPVATPKEPEKRVDVVGNGNENQNGSLPKKVSPWQKLRDQNATANDKPKQVNFELNDMASDKPTQPKLTSSGWGKLRARQNFGDQSNNTESVPMEEISTETPAPRKLDSLANAAYAMHATQKLTGVLKDRADKAKERVSIRERLALKERMAKLVAERLTIKQIFKRYVETSTLHGFCYVCTETFIVRRVIWALLMIFGAVYFLVKLNDGVHRYFTYPISTLSNTIFVPNLIFPAISFCPVNPYKLENFNTSILHKIQETSGLPLFSNWTNPGYDVSGQDLHDAIYAHAYDIDELAPDCDYIKQDTDHPMRAHRDCGPHNFTRYISQHGELCFTINSGHEDHPILNVNHNGIGYGYELLFDLNLPGSVLMEAFSGIRVILHDQNETPVFQTGFLLAPGFKSFIQMQRTETINLPPPVATRCGSKPLKYSNVYNQKNCFLEVITDRTGEACGCRELYMPDNGLPFCSLQQQLNCTQPFKEQISQLDLIDECPIDCKVTSFKTEKTDTRFLHNAPQGMMPTILLNNAARKGKNSSHLAKIYEELKGTDELDLYIEENMIRALFFYPEMKLTVNQQQQTFTFYHFLGDIGGEFGLMLGASLLTFVEFMDLLIFLTYHQMLRLNKQKKESAAGQQKT
ncbi:acid-sensing ion channel 2-like [Clytia hemisphaerica]|uniref:Uncharacterized protein n=1 Tax=Clytia hemisphaerica TaxID=252671 RepID=A0A7M5XI31_9CNID|eukprot:TCONS_00014188-protein